MSEVRVEDLERLKNDIILSVSSSDLKSVEISLQEFNSKLKDMFGMDSDVENSILEFKNDIIEILESFSKYDGAIEELYNEYKNVWHMIEKEEDVSFEVLLSRLTGKSYTEKGVAVDDIKLAKKKIAEVFNFGDITLAREMYNNLQKSASLVMVDRCNYEDLSNIRNSLNNNICGWWEDLNKDIDKTLDSYTSSEASVTNNVSTDYDNKKSLMDNVYVEDSKIIYTDMICKYGYGSETIKLSIICDSSITDGFNDIITKYDEEIENSLNENGDKSKDFFKACSDIFIKLQNIKFHIADVRSYLTTIYLSQYIVIDMTPELYLSIYGSEMPVGDSKSKSSKSISANDVYKILPDNAKVIWNKSKECMSNGETNKGFRYIDKMIEKLYGTEYYEQLKYALKGYIGNKSDELSRKLANVYPNLSKVLE